MYEEEEKIKNSIKITIFFLITMFGVAMFEELPMIVLLLFYIAFIKD
tara:strand:- start:516 stop:656 length:141 start_codon:yes stop_codon:yes gene_type:complete